MIKLISTSGGLPVIFLPLTVVLIISAIKDLIEDLKRHRDDENENESSTWKLDPDGVFQEVYWRSLQVGDIVKVYL